MDLVLADHFCLLAKANYWIESRGERHVKGSPYASELLGIYDSARLYDVSGGKEPLTIRKVSIFGSFYPIFIRPKMVPLLARPGGPHSRRQRERKLIDEG